MSYNVTPENFDSLASYWADPEQHLSWSSVFILPAWLRVWWQAFGVEAELQLRAVRQGNDIIGIAPLQVKAGKASFVGSSDVCDYLDFIVRPGMEKPFFNTLLDDLKATGVRQMDMVSLRPDSKVLTSLLDIAREREYEVTCRDEDVSLELDLPATWDEYLAMLDKKQRHEVKRKLKRFWAAGNVSHRCVELGRGIGANMDAFLKLFSLSRGEKASFMDARMEVFFRSLAKAMAEIGILRFGVVELDNQPVAMTLGFDYNDAHYLYNSAYDPRFNHLSVGLLCKVLCLKESIERGKKKWDFLRGGETYKYQLGGQEIPLYNCQIVIR